MNLDEITEGLRYEYEKKCDVCSLTQKILTQNSNFPEYESEVYLVCQCGNYIEFILPVN